MTEGDSTNPIDAAAEITDAMMSSLADVVKTVISKPGETTEADDTTTEKETSEGMKTSSSKQPLTI